MRNWGTLEDGRNDERDSGHGVENDRAPEDFLDRLRGKNPLEEEKQGELEHRYVEEVKDFHDVEPLRE